MSQFAIELNKILSRRLRTKQAALKANRCRDDQPACRRNEKSIALLISKMLCPHTQLIIERVKIQHRPGTTVYCKDCKASGAVME